MISEQFEIYREAYTIIDKTLDRYFCGYFAIDELSKQEVVAKLVDISSKDIDALVKNDPAARIASDLKKEEDKKEEIKTFSNNVNYVSTTYKSLYAVMMYRIAHYIGNFNDDPLAMMLFDEDGPDKLMLEQQARGLSEETKAFTGVEIHHRAKIGVPFVIDHGYGTVIGETCEIGDECYLLQGITLGATGIKDNESGRRHPKLGNRVQIAGFARLFGPITIGDDTIINGYTVIDRDISNNRRVSIVNQLQLILPKSYPVSIYGMHPEENSLIITGRNLNYCTSVNIVNEECIVVNELNPKLEINQRTIKLTFEKGIDTILNTGRKILRQYLFSIELKEGNILLSNSVAWLDFIENIKSKGVEND